MIQKRKGFSLLELWLVLVVTSMAFVTFMFLQTRLDKENDSETIAQEMKYIGESTKRYLEANQNALLEKTNGGAVYTVYVSKTTDNGNNTSTTYPDVVDNLQAGGYISPSFINMNRYQQEAYILIKQQTIGNLSALVVTNGGRQIQDSQLGRILNNMDASGGIIPANDINGQNGDIYGFGGTWVSNISDWRGGLITPSSGHVVYKVTLMTGNGANPDQFLARTTIGNGVSSGSDMHADLDMNGNDILGVTNTQANYIDSTAGDKIYVSEYYNQSKLSDVNSTRTGMIVTDSLFTQASEGKQTKNLPGFNNGLATWDLYAENSITTSDQKTLSTYMNGWNGSVAAMNYIAAPVLRPNYIATKDADCIGQPVPATSVYGNGSVSSQKTIQKGDLARDANGGLLVCQTITTTAQDGSQTTKTGWQPMFSKFTRLVDYTCPSKGDTYENDSGLPQFVTVTTNDSGSSDTSTRELKLTVSGQTVWDREEDAKHVSVIIAKGWMQQSKQFSGYAYVAPGKELKISTSGLGVANMCVYE